MSDYIGAVVVTVVEGALHHSTISEVFGPDGDETAVLSSGVVLPLRRVIVLR